MRVNLSKKEKYSPNHRKGNDLWKTHEREEFIRFGQIVTWGPPAKRQTGIFLGIDSNKLVKVMDFEGNIRGITPTTNLRRGTKDDFEWFKALLKIQETVIRPNEQGDYEF